MEQVSIKKLKAPALKKLAKGQSIRIQDGNDMQIFVEKAKVRKIMNAFKKKKGSTLALTKNELESSEMKGSGLFEDNVAKYVGVVKQIGSAAGKSYENTVGFDPFQAGYEFGYNTLGPAIDKAFSGKKKKPTSPPKAAKPTTKAPFVFGQGLYGGGLYASPSRISGRGKRLLDQSFTPREGINFFGSELPKAFGGGQLQRNKSDVLIERGSLGVGGSLVSRLEQPPALRSQPFAIGFASPSHHPQFKQFHNGMN